MRSFPSDAAAARRRRSDLGDQRSLAWSTPDGSTSQRLPGCRSAGYTLMEIIVATGLLVALGGGLVTLLREGVGIWETASERGRVYEEARAVLDLITEDLRSTAIRAHSSADDSWIRFLADAVSPETHGKQKSEFRAVQRLRFVRTTGGEMADPILRHGGKKLASRTPLYYDGSPLSGAAESGLLRPAAGTMEVLYMLDPRQDSRTLWRAVRAPVGGADSLFIDANVAPPLKAVTPPKAPAKPAGSAATSATDPTAKTTAPPPAPPPFYLSRFATPVSEQVLYVGFRFWTRSTTTWAETESTSARAATVAVGPSWYWDSTRALLRPKSRTRTTRTGSVEDASDDVFPEFVEVTLALEPKEEVLGPRLTAPMTAQDSTIQLSTPLDLPERAGGNYVLVGNEWIAVERLSGSTLAVRKGGRGVRGSTPSAHSRGTRVRSGIEFRRVVAIPSYRTGSEPPKSTRRTLRKRGRGR